MSGRVCRQYRAHSGVKGGGLQLQPSSMLHYYTNLMGNFFRVMYKTADIRQNSVPNKSYVNYNNSLFVSVSVVEISLKIFMR
jgi:hypothetical protein